MAAKPTLGARRSFPALGRSIWIRQSQSLNILMICLARGSLISVWRGIGWHAGFGVLVPIVPFAAADEDLSAFLDLADQIAALHERRNSATLRTSGIVPLVSSS